MKELLIAAVALLIVFGSYSVLRINKNDCAAKGGILLQSAGSYVCVEGKEIK
jgi:hypothetical protein